MKIPRFRNFLCQENRARIIAGVMMLWFAGTFCKVCKSNFGSVMEEGRHGLLMLMNFCLESIVSLTNYLSGNRAITK
jgi:hypothetical protein